MLFDESKLRANLGKRYDEMRKRVKPRYWKTGRLAGRLRTWGVESLPFSRKEFVAYALAHFGVESARRCEYCLALGRPANIIDLTSCQFDHKVPLAHMKSVDDVRRILALENIVPVCEDCNRLKGSMSYPFFVGFVKTILEWDDAKDRTYVLACLRTHGKTMRIQPGRAKVASKAEEVEF